MRIDGGSEKRLVSGWKEKSKQTKKKKITFKSLLYKLEQNTGATLHPDPNSTTLAHTLGRFSVWRMEVSPGLSRSTGFTAGSR